MNRQDEIVLRIKPDGSVTVEDTEKGIVFTKNITGADLIESIKDSIPRDPVKISTGILPKNCAAFCLSESGGRFVAVEFDAGYADVTYRNTPYPHFPLPKLVFGFHLNTGGKVTSVDLGVPANERLTEKTPMYIYPFSNVRKFGLCTGRNELPTVKSLSQLTGLPWFILGLPDNDDNYNDRNRALGMGHRELREHLKNRDAAYYYEKVLIPMRRNTFKDFINQKLD